MSTLIYVAEDVDELSANVDKLDLNNYLSSNIDMMRNEIKKLISSNSEKVLYSNPVRYILSTKGDNDSLNGGDGDANDTTNEAVNDDANDKTNEVNDDNANDTTNDTTNETPNDDANNATITNSKLLESMNAELLEYMKKEIKSIDGLNVDKFEIIEPNDSADYGFNFETMNPKTAYILQPINLNSIKFILFVDELAHYFKPVYIVKCAVDDVYTERVAVIVGDKKDNTSVKTDGVYIPTNQTSFIEFLYSIYSRALFVLKSSESEYKQFTNACVKLVRNIQMF